MQRDLPSKCLQWFAWLTSLATLVLISIGGLVTSHGAGMTVPDWPNSYGYNMFFFPTSLWVGGILYEHSHRLAGSAVGILTTVLAIWLWGQAARPYLRAGGVILLIAGAALALAPVAPYETSLILVVVGLAAWLAGRVWPAGEARPAGIRWLGVIAWFGVVIQGLLGGLRVTLMKDELGVIHAIFAQLFFTLICLIALLNSTWWQRWKMAIRPTLDPLWLRYAFLVITFLIFGQLVLGAVMRHQHAGLAIPDFPKAYGQWWPDTGAASLELYNLERPEAEAARPIQAFHIHLQIAHRLLAILILASTLGLALTLLRLSGWRGVLPKFACVWLGLLLGQAALGVATVLTGKSADIATAHVALGAVCLACGGAGSVIAFSVLHPFDKVVRTGRENKATDSSWQPISKLIPDCH